MNRVLGQAEREGKKPWRPTSNAPRLRDSSPRSPRTLRPDLPVPARWPGRAGRGRGIRWACPGISRTGQADHATVKGSPLPGLPIITRTVHICQSVRRAQSSRPGTGFRSVPAG